jgi:hypothetical protein
MGERTWYSVFRVTTQASCARTMVSHALTTLGDASTCGKLGFNRGFLGDFTYLKFVCDEKEQEASL